MTTWSTGSFDNADAEDFLANLHGVEDLSAIEEALEAVEASGREVEAYAGAAAVAAVEVLTGLMNYSSDAIDHNAIAAAWVAENEQKVSQSLVTRAVRVLERVLNPESELRQQWEETSELSDWLRHVHDLRSRLE